MQARCQKGMMFVVILSYMILVLPAVELFLVFTFLYSILFDRKCETFG